MTIPSAASDPLEADPAPERVMRDFKARASRLLNEHEPQRRNRWARHGSTKYLWKDEQVVGAVRYVLHQQGEPMEVFPTLHETAPCCRGSDWDS